MKSVRLAIVVLVASLLGCPVVSKVVLAQSEDAVSEYPQLPAGIEDRDISGRGKYLGWIRGEHRSWDKEKMLKLKAEDPEKFAELVNQRRTKIKERLEKLKEEDPERYKRLRQQMHLRRQRKMRRLKEEDPEKFAQVMKARKERFQERLEKLKTEDPQKYDEITKHLEEMEGLRNLRKENQARIEEYLKGHPGLKEGLKEGREGFKKDIRRGPKRRGRFDKPRRR